MEIYTWLWRQGLPRNVVCYLKGEQNKEKECKLLKNKLQKRRIYKEGEHLSNMLYYRQENFLISGEVPWLFCTTQASHQVEKKSHINIALYNILF